MEVTIATFMTIVIILIISHFQDANEPRRERKHQRKCEMLKLKFDQEQERKKLNFEIQHQLELDAKENSLLRIKVVETERDTARQNLRIKQEENKLKELEIERLAKEASINDVYNKGLKAIERGKLSEKMKREIKKRDHYTCQICGASQLVNPNLKLHIDHKIPIARGGKTEESNLWVLCEHCNTSKGKKTVEEFLDWRLATGAK